MWCLVSTTKRFQKSSGVIAFHSPNHQEQRPPGQLLEVPTPVRARGPARCAQLLGGRGWNKNAICTVQLYVQLIEHSNWTQLKFPILICYNIYLDFADLQLLWHDFLLDLNILEQTILIMTKNPANDGLFTRTCARGIRCMILLSNDVNKYSSIHLKKLCSLFSLSVENSCHCQCVVPPFFVIPW